MFNFPLSRQSSILKAALLLLTVTLGLHAQFQRGTILGTVSDPTGSAVINSKITLRNTSTNEHRVASTNERGDYEFPLLVPGTY